MAFKDAPIQIKLMMVILITSGAVLLMTCSAFFVYEYLTFRKTTIKQLATLGEIVAENSTAALAFDSRKDASQILATLKAKPNIEVACLYNANGKPFAYYPSNLSIDKLPTTLKRYGFFFEKSHLLGFQPVIENGKQLGLLYLKSDLKDIYERFRLYGIIIISIIVISFLLAYFLSMKLQQIISKPILLLAETAKAISNRQDYSVRASKSGNDELGLLTDAFNHMLARIEDQNLEITSFSQSLEQKVNERTEQLEAANKELEAFSYSVSHDLRAPLRAVNGYAKMLEEDYNSVFDDEGKRLLGVVQKNAAKMGALIDDLLAFSRLGRKEVTRSVIEMTELAESVIFEINKTTSHQAKIIVHPLAPVKADRALINQVLTNLLGNAIKYSSGTQMPVIEIKSYRKNKEIIYMVTDNGAGFDSQYINKLFGVFQRLHSTEEFEGTGVGLALVKRIITKHEGKVWASGKVNEGAKFYFSLPDADTLDI